MWVSVRAVLRIIQSYTETSDDEVQHTYTSHFLYEYLNYVCITHIACTRIITVTLQFSFISGIDSTIYAANITSRVFRVQIFDTIAPFLYWPFVRV